MSDNGAKMTDALAAGIISEARRRMVGESRERILTCLEKLSDAEIWHRPNAETVSIGNLVLHLCGNVRQWIVSGIGGAPDVRRRAYEFSERGPIPRAVLISRLNETLSAADETLKSLDSAALARTYRIQGNDETGVAAVIHVVEHFSYHTGQIVYFVKSRHGVDLGFYAGQDLNKLNG